MKRKSGRNCSLILKTIVLVSMAAAVLFGPRAAVTQTAGAGAQKALELLRKAEAACSAKEFSKGVDLTYKAATASHGAPSTHPARKKWRPQLRKCYNAWINDIAKACKPDPGTLDRMKELTRIAKQAQKVAEAAVARKALARRKACFLSLAGKLKKHCTQDPGAGSVRLARGLVKLISSMGKKIPAVTVTRMTTALPFCLDQWLKSAITRCQAMPSVTLLRELETDGQLCLAALSAPPVPKGARSSEGSHRPVFILQGAGPVLPDPDEKDVSAQVRHLPRRHGRKSQGPYRRRHAQRTGRGGDRAGSGSHPRPT
jgi:hypothetical protein